MTEPTAGQDPAAAPSTEGIPAKPTRPAKPDRGLNMDQAVALVLERSRSASAPTPAPGTRPPPAAKANPPEAPSQGAEGAEPEADAVDGEQLAPEGDGEQQVDEAQPDEPVRVVLNDEMTLVLPDGREISAADLSSGIMMERDYRKKTAALAERGRALETLERQFQGQIGELTNRLSAAEEAAKTAAGERERYTEQVDRILKAQKEHCAQWDRVDWDKLDSENPTYANQLWRKRERDFEALRRIETESVELETKRQADLTTRQQKAQDDYVTSWHKARSDLYEHARQSAPTLFDPSKGAEEWGQIEATLKDVGLSDDQIQAAFGARHDFGVPIISVPIFKLIRKAALFDQAVARVQGGKGSAAGETRLPAADADGKIRVMQANTTRVRVPNAAQAALGRAQAQFNRTGTIKDAVALELAKHANQRQLRG